jgi:bacteriocin-like protein
MNNEIRELNINELDAVSGGGIYEAIGQIIAYAKSSFPPLTSGSGSGSGDGLGSGGFGSGSGSPCPGGCHVPA